jgi:hypothetical protein
VAVRHSVIGIGMGNFHHYSLRELVPTMLTWRFGLSSEWRV